MAYVLPHPGPPLPVQSPLQLQLVQKMQDRAVGASAYAHGILLEWLNNYSVPAIRSVCPSLENASAEDILRRYHAEMRIAELTHNFAWNQTGPAAEFQDVSIHSLYNASYVYNLWELITLGFQPAGLRQAEDAAEVVLMQYPPFPGGKPPGNGTPTTFNQSAERPIYTLMNLLHLDVGNWVFGDITIVFNRTYVDPLALVAPIDTGTFVSSGCLGGKDKSRSKFSTDANQCNWPFIWMRCQDWPYDWVMGTLTNISATMDHVILENELLWAGVPGCPNTNTPNSVRNFQRICYHEHPAAEQPAFDLVHTYNLKNNHPTNRINFSSYSKQRVSKLPHEHTQCD